MQVERKNEGVTLITFDDVKEGWEKWFLLSSDRHHDSPDSDRKFEKRHLDMCVERDAHIFDFGDLFDAMEGRYDVRKNNIVGARQENIDIMREKECGYLPALVESATQFYGPYANRFILMGRGNHETAIAKHNDTDLTSLLVYRLNSEYKSDIHLAQYAGWVMFRFMINKTRSTTIFMRFHHGFGGSAPVSKGVIHTNRQAVYLPDAHIVCNGHNHENWLVPIGRLRINSHGTITQDYQMHVRTGTYKDSFDKGSKGWGVEKGFAPHPIGAVWMRFYIDNGVPRYEFTQAIR